MNIDSSMIDSLGMPVYGIVNGNNTMLIPISVKIEGIESSVFYNSFVVIVTESGATYYEVGPNYGSDIYLSDIDGDGSDELLINQLVAVTGGAGGYNSSVYKFENEELISIFEFPWQDIGYSSVLKDGFKLEISNRFTDYKKVLDFSDTEQYKGVYFDESGKVSEEYKNINCILIDSFKQFVPSDVDNDGICEISCLQYTSLYGHSDYIGDCKTILKYEKNTGEFVVADAEFIPFEREK